MSGITILGNILKVQNWKCSDKMSRFVKMWIGAWT